MVECSSKMRVGLLPILWLGVLVGGCNNDPEQAGFPGNQIGVAGMGQPVAGTGAPAGMVPTGTGGTTAGTGAVPMGGMTAGMPMAGMEPVAGQAMTGGMEASGGMGATGGMEASGGMGATGGMEASGGMGATGGMEATGGTGPVGEPGPIPPRCTGDGSTVAIIGDSYIALSNEIPRLLQQYSGQSYRNYAVSGTVIQQIRSQAQTAYRTPTKTLIMTGGGNDALLNTSCLFAGFTGSCKTSVDTAIGVVPMLLAEAEEAGVQEVVFFYYPHITGSTNPPAMNEIDDYALPLVQKHCEDRTKLDCTFLDTREAFGENSPYFIFDGIHPNSMGSKIIADMIWEVMEDHCENGLDIE